MNFEVKPLVNAKCKCGAVTAVSREQPLLQLCCHCQHCRQASKQDFSNIAFFNVDAVEITGSLKAHNFEAELGNKTQREYCPICSSVMFDRSEGFPHLIGIFIDRIEPPFEANIGCHVWTKSKVVEEPIPADIKSYEKGIT